MKDTLRKIIVGVYAMMWALGMIFMTIMMLPGMFFMDYIIFPYLLKEKGLLTLSIHCLVIDHIFRHVASISGKILDLDDEDIHEVICDAYETYGLNRALSIINFYLDN